jgi:hypothetical protein
MVACKQTFVPCDILPRGAPIVEPPLLWIRRWPRELRMNRWISKYGAVAVLVMLLLVMNPELRAFLLLANFIGLDLMIFFIVIQLRYLLPAIPSYPHQMGRYLCVASYTALRVTTRTIGLLLVPAERATAGLTTLLFVLSKNMWCPKQKQDFQQI